MSKKSFSIYDVAKAADVSTATVSRVMSGVNNVSAPTRQKVLSVMTEMGYTPNAFAQGLGLGTMRAVGVMCTDVSDIFYAKCVSIIERLLREKKLSSFLYCTGSDIYEKHHGLDFLCGKGVDAIILVGSQFTELSGNPHFETSVKTIPIFCINGLIEAPNVYSVVCDEHKGMCDSATALIQHGCRHILYLYDILTYSGLQKLEGYKSAHDVCNMSVDQRLIVAVHKDLDVVSARVNALIDSGINIDAVLASEDILAIGAQKALFARNMALPIIGFNNSVLAECATPTLTSTDNMIETQCNVAILALDDVLEGKTATRKIVIPPKLIQRESFNTKTVRTL